MKKMFRYRPLIAAVLGLSALEAQGTSLTELMDRVPAPLPVTRPR